MNENPKHWGDTEFGECVGAACVILAVLLGIGGCCALGGSFHAEFKDLPATTTSK